MSGNLKYTYPGWGLDLGWKPAEPHTDDGESHGYAAAIYGGSNTRRTRRSEMLCVREVAMLLAMDNITDKKDWHIHIFDAEIAAQWRAEIIDWPDDDLWNRIPYFPPLDESRGPVRCPEDILNDQAADYCIAELREKAEYFTRTGIIPTLDATFTVVKSDVLVPGDLREALREAFARLRADQATRPDWHPNTNDVVQDLVHPSMYPLVYGRSRFFEDEVVGVDDAVGRWAGKGDVIPHEEDGVPEEYAELLSDEYQWLPANLEFTASGGVKFTSYINNLHPTKYRDIYATIEKLVEKAIPMWDQCLVPTPKRRQHGRQSPRLAPTGDKSMSDTNELNWEPWWRDFRVQRGQVDLWTYRAMWSDRERWAWEWEAREEWKRIRKPVQLTPKPSSLLKAIDYNVGPARTLGQRFKDSGLQIIVKMTSIELTPEKPKLPRGGWQVEGQMNEHIVATALYYVDSENVDETVLEFGARTSANQTWRGTFVPESCHWVESIYGVRLGDETQGMAASPCLQNYGSLLTREGRLVAFPNVFQHRTSGFELKDPSKPGHCRFIALCLVNPRVRVINTGNVPPQQAEWWAESAFGTPDGEGATGASHSSTCVPPEIAVILLEHGIGRDQLGAALEKEAKLPNEVLDMVREELGGPLPMSRAEAEEHRRKLMQERSVLSDGCRPWDPAVYVF